MSLVTLCGHWTLNQSHMTIVVHTMQNEWVQSDSLRATISLPIVYAMLHINIQP